MFKKEILQIFVGAFLLSLKIGSDILDSIMSMTMGYNWQYMEFLMPFILSWRRTVVFLILYLFKAKRDILEKLKTSNTL